MGGGSSPAVNTPTGASRSSFGLGGAPLPTRTSSLAPSEQQGPHGVGPRFSFSSEVPHGAAPRPSFDAAGASGVGLPGGSDAVFRGLREEVGQACRRADEAESALKEKASTPSESSAGCCMCYLVCPPRAKAVE